MVVASLIALAGQLALIRLALGPSVTVGAAIAHGVRRLPVYLLAAIADRGRAVRCSRFPSRVALAAIGVPLDAKTVPVAAGSCARR